MPQFDIECLKTDWGEASSRHLTFKGDVIRLSRLLREENPEPRTYKRARLISDIREDVIDSYKRLHNNLQGPVLFNNSKHCLCTS